MSLGRTEKFIIINFINDFGLNCIWILILIKLIPAPKGTGLCVEKECKKVLSMAGIKDIYSKSRNNKTKSNLIKACFNALRKLSEMKVDESYAKRYNIIEGRIK